MQEFFGANIDHYGESLRRLLSERLDEMQGAVDYKTTPLTVTDKLVVQAAYDIAVNGKPVAVATADSGIDEKINNIYRDYGVDITLYSPWRIPVKHDLINILVDGRIFPTLKELAEKKELSGYLAVKRNVHIGGNAHYDVAFCFYKPDLTLPNIEDGYLVRVVDTSKFSRQSMLEGQIDRHWAFPLDFFLNMVTSRYITFYHRELPNDIAIVKQDNPLSHQDKVMYLKKARQGNLTRQEESKINDRKVKALLWARIEEDDIARHDKLSVGLLNQLRMGLDNKKAG